MGEIYDLLAKIRYSKRAKEALELLDRKQSASTASKVVDDSMDSNEVATQLGIQINNAIKYLNELEGLGAVTQVTTRIRGRRYKISEDGKAALNMIRAEQVNSK